jgi:predicted nuclease of predicted toxin-antitoxin system
MKFQMDQDVYAVTARLLRDGGHDVVLTLARRESRVLVSRDRDFGWFIFVDLHAAAGVIYLRVLPSALRSVHEELGRVLKSYSEEDLHKAFVVVEPGRHRLRRSP